ncbi:MAG: DUF5818 domain-containing protein [Terriglobia bacterium]
MKGMAYLLLIMTLAASLSFAAPKGKVFVGSISDDMCGLKHMMPGKNDKDCALECVKAGSKFVLADTVHNKVYQLSDQEKPRNFAGEKVKVSGTLKGDTIEVTSIEAAK